SPGAAAFGANLPQDPHPTAGSCQDLAHAQQQNICTKMLLSYEVKKVRGSMKVVVTSHGRVGGPRSIGRPRRRPAWRRHAQTLPHCWRRVLSPDRSPPFALSPHRELHCTRHSLSSRRGCPSCRLVHLGHYQPTLAYLPSLRCNRSNSRGPRPTPHTPGFPV